VRGSGLSINRNPSPEIPVARISTSSTRGEVK
jgi:hypothetical protein